MPMLLSKYFPQWNKIDTVQLCVTILQKLKYLHDRNVILGDINPYNILVVSPTEVYFVDTDSYQVEGFICPVGMPIFTAPELHKKNSQYGLRTLGNENNLLLEKGEPEEYLTSYQKAYSNRAEKIADKLATERGVNEELYKRDSLEWILKTEKIQEEVHDTLAKEIQR